MIFVGNHRSGSSILGSLMDAHPHMLIANEWRFPDSFYKMSTPKDNFKNWLFNALYSKCANLHRIGENEKGYTLEVRGMWQGKFDEYVEIIGDKSAGWEIPYLLNTTEFKKNFDFLEENLQVPIYAIQPIQNPFDMIAGNLVLKFNWGSVREKFKAYANLKHNSSGTVSKLKNNSTRMNMEVDKVFSYFIAALDVTEKVIGKDNVLQVHNCDLVQDPKGILSKVFAFLGVDTTEHFLDVCAEKVFDSGSKTRNTVEWTPEQIERIEARMKKYEALRRYSFTSC